MALEQFVNGVVSTTLSSGITNSQTTVSVTSATGFPASGNFRIRIGNELMLVTGVSGTTFTVTRGVEGTSGEAQVSGVAVNFYITKGALDALRSEFCMSGAYASRPSSGIRTGAYYFPNDFAHVFCRWNGSAWEEFGPIKKLVLPGTSFGTDYSTWFQQGSATLTQNGQSYILKVPAETAGVIRAVYKTAPSTPYTIECGLRFLGYPSNYTGGGLFWQSSADSKHTNFGVMYHSSPGIHIGTDKYNGDGTFNASYNTPVSGNPRYSMIGYAEYFRFSDDGTNRYMQYSVDGDYWVPWVTVGRTDFHTPNRIGFGAQTSNNKDFQMEIFHYSEY